jgi:hypothetical protein
VLRRFLVAGVSRHEQATALPPRFFHLRTRQLRVKAATVFIRAFIVA